MSALRKVHCDESESNPMSNLIILGIVLLAWIALNMIAAFIWFYFYDLMIGSKKHDDRRQ